MQMKRILGILLAFCFLMSVTAAAVSAGDNRMINDHNKPVKDHDKDKHKNFMKGHKHFVKGHWETKLVKKFVGFRHGKPVYVYKLVKVFVPAKWMYYY
jgi:Ni/Co efflux regulator RcnB